MKTLREYFEVDYLPKRLHQQCHRSNVSHWKRAIDLFAEYLGHEPTADDLTDQNILAAMRYAFESGQSVRMANVVVEKVAALWRFLRQSGIVAAWPPFPSPFMDDDGTILTGKLPQGRRYQGIVGRRCGGRKPLLPPKPAGTVARPLVALSRESTLEDVFTAYAARRLVGCNPNTPTKFRAVIGGLGEMLGRPAVVTDLVEETVLAYTQAVLDAGATIATAKWHRSKLVALWGFVWKRGILSNGPDLPKMRVPKRAPFAWSVDQLEALFAAVRRCDWEFGTMPFSVWLTAFLLVLWDSGERLNAALSIRWRDIDLQTGWLTIPAEQRKGKVSDLQCRLHAQTLEAIERLKDRAVNTSPDNVVFFWPFHEATLFNRYKMVLRDAGLPYDRKCMFHAMRKSVASHLQAAGGDAQAALGHSDRRVTDGHYLDPRITNTKQPADLLFRPDGGPRRLEGPRT